MHDSQHPAPLSSNKEKKVIYFPDLAHKPSLKATRLGLCLFFFSYGLCFASWASRIPDIKNLLQLSDGQLGAILLMLPAGQLIAMPFSGRLVARFGSNKTVVIGIILYALALINIGLVTYPWQLFLSLFVFGMFGNMANISANTQAIGVEKMIGKPIMISFHGLWSVAGFTGAMIGIFMMTHNVSLLGHFCSVAALVICLVLIGKPFLVRGRSELKQSKKSFFTKPDPELIKLGTIGFCSMASEGAMFDWSGVYFQKVVSAPPGLIILGYAAFMSTMAGGRFFGDSLVKKIGAKNLLQLSGFFIAGGLIISITFPTLLFATLGFLIVGFGVSSVVPTVYSSAGKAQNISPSMALAAVSSISFLGFLCGPPLIGYVSQLSNLRYSFGVIALLGFCTTLMVGRAKLIK
ncbi:MFS transporter [Sphingobacteriaceae bacterium]|nr:MFS transporter [Sphingobacteriaceae bacterium]